MKGKKNLERAIILGLILSTGVYGSVLAAPPQPIDDSTNDLLPSYDTSVTFVGDEDTSAINIGNKNISIVTTNPNNGTITLESGEYGIKLSGNVDITLDSSSDNIIEVSLNKNDGINDHSDGVVVNSGTVKLIADNTNKITAGKLGLSAVGVNSKIYLEGKTNKIIVSYDKFANYDSSVYALNVDNGNIYINNDENKADKTIISATSSGKTGITAVNINNGGDIVVNSKEISISAYKTNEEYKNDAQVSGIYLNNNTGNEIKSSIDLNSTNDIDVYVESVGTKANGIFLYNNSTANIRSDSGNVNITVKTGAPDPISGNVYGIYANNDSVIDVAAKKNIVITTSSNVEEQSNGSLDVSAVRGNYGGQVNLNADGFLVIDTKDVNSSNYGIAAISDDAQVNLTTKGKNEDGIGIIINSIGKDSYASSAQNGSISMSAEGGDVILNSSSRLNSRGVYNGAIDISAITSIKSNENDIFISAKTNTDITTAYAHGVYNTSMLNSDAKTELVGDNITISAISDNTTAYGIYADSVGTGKSKVIIDGNNINISSTAGKTGYGILSTNADVDIDVDNSTIINSSKYGLYAYDFYSNDAVIDINSGIDNNIYGKTTGIMATGEKAVTNLTAGKGTNLVQSVDGIAIRSENNAKTVLKAENAYNNVISDNSTGIYSKGTSDVENNTKVELIAKGNNVSGSTGIWGLNNGKVSLGASTLTNEITADAYGIYADTKSDIDLNAENSNNILAAKTTITNEDTGVSVDYGQQEAIYALSGSDVDLAAGEQNYLLGAVYANGSGTNVDVKGKDSSTATNVVRSAAVIDGAGGLDGKVTTTDPETGESVTTGLDVVSALYAEKGAVINVSGINDFRTYYSNPLDSYTSERVVWAYDTADINIDGYTNISTTLYNESPNSKDIAIAAGTATNLKADDVNAPVEDRATVTLNYDNFTTNDGKQAVSEITGDILSAYAGQVDITTDNSEASININGNLLAGNNGILNVNLGEGGVLTGRADDYGDAGANPSGVGDGNDGHQSSEFFYPAFSSEIFKGGEVNLTMGENSRWNVTGQSWITRINTAENSNAIIDLVGSNTDRNTTAHALTVYEMNGDANFNMSLDADRDVSDMLYIKNANGNYVVNVIDAVTEEDMYAARTDGGTFDGLRFATVGKDSTASFRAITYDGGFNNVEYIIGSDSYDESTENHHYNGDSLDAEKPGDSTVDDFFKNNGTPGSTTGATNGLAKASLMALPVNETNNAENDDLTNVEVNTDETTNFKLIGVKNTEVSDGGKTMLNMSRANYSNAIYMDRLNKRLGEARYINSEEDEGMWVRIRHDRIGKDDAYRSQNTMYELGYDQKQECDNGERRVGMAIDYMHGDTGYNDIAGKGEIDRYGLWLYDTWMGDKGHYADYVAKWGHLSNDFEIYNSRGEVTGDYSNNVFSVSAEYGRKKDIGNDWYFEPQVQAQLARVTGADYTTNQGTKVSVDGINSLIGRAGFRLGKDFGEEKQSTVYIKADVLHEFLGDQDIRELDSTTNGNWQTVSYENEGTWYDVGFGFATQMSKNSYAFMDFEKSFGNDNDETYQINVGMQWSF